MSERNVILVDGDVVDQETGEVLGQMPGEQERPAGRSLVRVEPQSIAEFVANLASPEEIERQRQLMAAYDQACDALVGPNDVQEEGGRRFKKKSAWRKLGRYFRVSTEIIRVEGRWEWDEDDEVRHFKARVIARGTAPWGQSMDGIGVCSTRETRFWTRGPLCPTCSGPMWDNRDSDRSRDDFKCRRKACGTRLYPEKYVAAEIGVGAMVPNRTAFAKAEHDCEATAATRASNRVISDLIAAGEVSAEEVEGSYVEEAPPKGRDERPEPASEQQVSTIEKLLESRHVTAFERSDMQKIIQRGLTTGGAKAAIERLGALIQEREGEAPEAQAEPNGGSSEAEPEAPPPSEERERKKAQMSWLTLAKEARMGRQDRAVFEARHLGESHPAVTEGNVDHLKMTPDDYGGLAEKLQDDLAGEGFFTDEELAAAGADDA